jgi:hypothetical protein
MPLLFQLFKIAQQPAICIIASKNAATVYVLQNIRIIMFIIFLGTPKKIISGHCKKF